MDQKNTKNRNITLVVMAAGIGSRFGGGIKQLEPVGPNGEIIMDYSIHDALEAGCNKVVFIIRRDIEEDFKEIIGKRIEKLVPVEYVYQLSLIHIYKLDHAVTRTQKLILNSFGLDETDIQKRAEEYGKLLNISQSYISLSLIHIFSRQ